MFIGTRIEQILSWNLFGTINKKKLFNQTKKNYTDQKKKYLHKQKKYFVSNNFTKMK